MSRLYKCDQCNTYFENPKIIRGDYHPETTPQSYEPNVGVCPVCGGDDYEEAIWND